MADEFIPELTLNPNSPWLARDEPRPRPGGSKHRRQRRICRRRPGRGQALSPAEAVEDFARTIDITDSNVVLSTARARKMSPSFPKNLAADSHQDLGQIGETLADLVRQLRNLTRRRRKKALPAFSAGKRISWPP
ncbi:MAG: hypothetical protein ACLS43_09775 [Evtepia gabavorous]